MGEPLVNQFHALGVFRVGALCVQATLEVVQNGKQGPNGLGAGILQQLHSIFVDAPAEILKAGYPLHSGAAPFGPIR